MPTMKQEPTESSSSTALASRIARYSYEATPRPNGKRKATSVKREPGPSVSPHFTRNRGSVLSPVGNVVRSPHFSKPPTNLDPQGPPNPQRASRAVLNDESDTFDDLESIDGSAAESRAGVELIDYGEQEYESDGLGDLVSSDESEEEEAATPSRQSQTRIRARRAGPTEQHLIQEGESDTRTRKRQRIKREGDDYEKSTPKKKKAPRGYAAPETYQHLRPLPDILVPGLDGKSGSTYDLYQADNTVVFCGIKYDHDQDNWTC